MHFFERCFPTSEPPGLGIGKCLAIDFFCDEILFEIHARKLKQDQQDLQHRFSVQRVID